MVAPPPNRPGALTSFSVRRAALAAGFTLVELIVVLVITSILAALASPPLASIPPPRRNIAARQVVRDLAHARDRAISTGTRTWVVFSIATDSYSILAEDPANPGRAGAMVLPDPTLNGQTYVRYFGVKEFPDVSLASAVFDAGSEVGFDWKGKPYNSTSAALAVAGVVTFTGGTTITVQAETGTASTP